MNEENFQTIDINLILSKIPLSASSRIADLGCGNFGYFLFPLSRLAGPQAKIYAIDVVPGHLESIRRQARLENLNNIEALLVDLERVGTTPLPDSSLDGALLVNTLAQSDKRKDLLQEALRLLKPGAWLLIIERNSLDPKIGLAAERRVSQETLLSAGNKLNLELSEVFQPGSHYYGLLFLKR